VEGHTMSSSAAHDTGINMSRRRLFSSPHHRGLPRGTCERTAYNQHQHQCTNRLSLLKIESGSTPGVYMAMGGAANAPRSECGLAMTNARTPCRISGWFRAHVVYCKNFYNLPLFLKVHCDCSARLSVLDLPSNNVIPKHWSRQG
jgi:hypothetical protein